MYKIRLCKIKINYPVVYLYKKIASFEKQKRKNKIIKLILFT